MTGGDHTADKLKGNLLQLKDKIDTLKGDSVVISDNIKQETYLREAAEAEVAAMTRRIRLLEEDLEMTSSRLAETTAKLEEASKIAEESERGWRENVNRLDTSNDSIMQLEKAAMEAVYTADEGERKYKEVSRNLMIAEEHLHATENRIAHTDARIQQMENELKSTVSKLKAIEIKREESAETEKNLEDRFAMLKRHVKEAESRAQMAESDMTRRKAEVKLTKERISLERNGYDTLRKEMDTMINEFSMI